MRVDCNIEPDLNSDRIVAKLIFSVLTMRTKQIILADGVDAVLALNQLTEGYARAVRDELIRLLKSVP